MADGMAVEAVGVSKRFGSVVALDGISVAVARGEVYGLLGPNGAGKTTFLRVLFGLVRPDSGTLRVFGRDWRHDGVRTLAGVSGFVESPRFYPYLSGRANLSVLARLDGGAPQGRLDEVLDVVDLSGRAGEKVGGYSFGMRQRLGVAAAPTVADKGAGADWICMVHFTDDAGQPQDGKFEVQVKADSCYVAGGPSKLVGNAVITDAGGRDVPNPAFEWDGCFDPEG